MRKGTNVTKNEGNKYDHIGQGWESSLNCSRILVYENDKNKIFRF